MIPFWYGVIAVMLAVYVVLDGFDFGVGILHLFVARTDGERRALFASIGPVWDGNEVWLIAAGGALFCAFPTAYAIGFSGFYLPLMIVLWLIIARGLAIELRSQLDNPLWTDLWDALFALASTLLALVLGAALGNVLRGVSLDATGNFVAPLFTHFLPSPDAGILDGYTILLGVFAVVLLALHGNHWLILRIDGPVLSRARALSKPLSLSALILGIACIVVTYAVQPSLYRNLLTRPLAWPLPALALASILLTGYGLSARGARWMPFTGTAIFILATLASTAAALFPIILRSSISPAFNTTAPAAASSVHGLRVALHWWLLGFPLALAYTFHVYRSMRERVQS